jgi:AraC-like DNA-binding protein
VQQVTPWRLAALDTSHHQTYDSKPELTCGSAGRNGRISTVFVRALADVLHQRGHSAAVLLEAGLQPKAAAEAAWLPLDEYARLVSGAIALAQEPALGLLCGAAAIEPSFDVVGTLVAHTPTLRHAIEAAAQFHPLLIDGAALHFEERVGRAQLRCEFPRSTSLLDRALAELGVAGLWRMLRAFAVEPEAVYAVGFTHAAPSYRSIYNAMFLGRERFEQAATGLELASSVLDRPNPHYQPELLAVLRGQAERGLDRLAQVPSFVEQVDMALRRQPLGRMPDMKPIARELGMSTRSLRRRLEEEGTSFREVTRAALEAAARSMLRHPGWTVQGTSHALGFSHVTTFHRAFKRWTGLTPQEYRERSLAGDLPR